jgi:hypothetical protein
MPVSYAGSPSTVTVTAWNSLAAGARAGSAAIDNSTTLWHAGTFEATLAAASAPAAGTNYIEFWLEPSVDGTTFGADGGVYLASVARSTANATAEVYTFEFSARLGILPKFFRITIVDRMNVAIGTGSALRWVGSKAA